MFIRYFSRRKNLRNLALKYLINSNETLLVKSLSIAMGVSIGIMPIWGFQMLAAVFLAAVFRLNKFLAMMSTHISFPPLIPLVIYLSFETGKLWTTGKTVSLSFSNGISMSTIRLNLFQYLYGSLTLAVICGFAAFALVYGILRLYQYKGTR